MMQQYDYLRMTREKYEGIWNLNLYLQIMNIKSLTSFGKPNQHFKCIWIDEDFKWMDNQIFSFST